VAREAVGEREPQLAAPLAAAGGDAGVEAQQRVQRAQAQSAVRPRQALAAPSGAST